MDVPELTPSREKTEKPPKNAVYKYPIGFEVRRQIQDIDLFEVCREVFVGGLLRI